MNRLIGAAMAALLVVPQASTAQTAEQTQALESFEQMIARINLLPDSPGSGPYPAVIHVTPALPDHVVYHPADLAAVGRGKLGLFVWGNGGCAADGTSSRFHLAEIASHGYLVIAPGRWRSGPNAREGAEPPRAPGSSPSPTTAAQLTQALDWALAENARVGSPLHGMIDQGALAAGGFSCGKIQTLTIAGDPRLSTVVVQNSGLLPPDAPRLGGMDLGKEGLLALHTPVLYLDGGPTDIAYNNGLDDVNRIHHVPVAWVNRPTGHGGSYHEPFGGRNASIVVDWLEWQLRGDATAGRTFTGPACRLCSDAEATIEWRNYP